MSSVKSNLSNKKARQDAFLKQLEATGNISMAARNAKVPRRTADSWRLLDAEYKKRFDASVVIGIEVLEDEAQRRAVHGVDKPVYQAGKLVGHIKQYSDSLLMFLLKGKKPEVYKDRVEHSGEIKQNLKIGYGKKSED